MSILLHVEGPLVISLDDNSTARSVIVASQRLLFLGAFFSTYSLRPTLVILAPEEQVHKSKRRS